MTQNVQNLVKAINYGADLKQFGFEDRDIVAQPKLAKTLVPIANAKAWRRGWSTQGGDNNAGADRRRQRETVRPDRQPRAVTT
jgi:hypothetical protein